MSDHDSPGQSFGTALPDQVDRIAGFFDAHLEVISDTRELYAARVTLEREFASKLQALVRKASEKKAKALSVYVFGNEPTKSWDSNTLKQSTLDNAYEELIKSMSNTAQDHLNFADALTSQTIEILRILEKRNEDSKKKEMAFFQKLLSDRDRVYADRIKSKQKGRASDDRHADRAARQAEQQRNDMLNSKNSYLISIAIANQAKGKFYQEDVPKLEDELRKLLFTREFLVSDLSSEALQRCLMERFVKIVAHGQSLQLNHLDSLKLRITDTLAKFEQVDIVKDQDLFIDHNKRVFTAPEDWIFEPCSVHYDTDTMSTEPAPKIFIQNKLRRSREKLQELTPLTESKRAESNQLSSQLSSYTADVSVGPIDDLTDKHLEAEHQLVFYTTSERILTTEIETIIDAIGDDEGASHPHSFKSSSFSIPTSCGYCKSSIWGLSKQGKTCRTCGLSVHAKCELKVPANCEIGEEHKSTSFLRRSVDTGPRESTPAITPSASSFVQSISSEQFPEEAVNAKVLFDFTPTSEFELGVHEGTIVRVVEADDGSGWVKVSDGAGDSGLVPASYLETISDDQEQKRDNAYSVGRRVRALYSYASQGSDELSLEPGDLLTLSAGGENYGNGWWEGYNAQGRKGIFPSNYVESM
ncbi:hypothetical protein CVT25_005619 [Psilocybe cyanescens]|uniref:Protein BZZ1 n=1 Tax=Psilocybe cyanescens TaxID=93625 RepID=A0A409X694_PSICY|nr:hypothetical protein CVT25_005619 [Psilocybe cyanescens]